MTENDGVTRSRRGLVWPRAATRLRPISPDSLRLREGFWAERAAVNEGSLAGARDQLESWGALPYLRSASERTGPPEVPTHNDRLVYKIFDSDIYKWLEAIAVEATRKGLPAELQDSALEMIGLIESAQWPSGYIDSSATVHNVAPFAEWNNGTELYNQGHLIQAATAWARAFDDDRLLACARRLADLLIGRVEGAPRLMLAAHPGLEMAFVELYRETGDAAYLKSAQEQLDRRGYGLLGPWLFTPDHWGDHSPIRESRTIQGHAVMALFLLCGVVDVAIETRDNELLEVAVVQWEDMVNRKLYITGGIGSRHHDEGFGDPFELAPDTAYAETCAAVASIMLSWRLLLATGEARYADLIERTLYNGLLAGVSLDGCSYFYANPLHVRVPGRVLSPDGYGHRQPWFECACCPPNLMRAIAGVEQLIATRSDDGLQIHQFISSEVRTDGRGVEINSDLPFGDGVTSVRVTESDGDEWTISVRRPEWAPTMEVAASWSSAPIGTFKDGYLSIRRRWQVGDELTLQVPMQVVAVHARTEVDAVRGQSAIMRGPIVYCFEDTDLPGSADVNNLQVDVQSERMEFTMVEDLGVLGIRLAGTLVATEGPLYHTGEPIERPGSSTIVTAIPYFSWGNRDEPSMRVWVSTPRHASDAELSSAERSHPRDDG